MVNEINENECELENVNCDLCNGLLCPPPHPTPYPTPAPQPTVFDFINSRAGLREQPVLKDLFVIVYGVNIIGNDLNNVCDYFNENFYCNGYYCGVLLSPPYPTPTPGVPIADFINSRSGLREQLVLKDLFDIICGDFGIENSVINEICNGVFIFF